MSSKRSRTEEPEDVDELPQEIDPKVQKILDEITPIESEITELEKKKERQILELELKYSKELLPLSKKRNQLAEKIPNFWLTTFEHHPILSASLTDEDKQLLTFLKEFDVEVLDAQNSYRITFKFRDNDFLQTTTLWKEFTFDENGSSTSRSSEVKWKPGKDLTVRNQSGSTGKKRAAEEIEEIESFWNFFTTSQELPFEQELGSVLKDEIWAQPVRYFKEPVHDGDDDDDDEDDEEVEEFDDDGEAEGQDDGADGDE